jgi:hypothetical protein
MPPIQLRGCFGTQTDERQGQHQSKRFKYAMRIAAMQAAKARVDKDGQATLAFQAACTIKNVQ